MEEIEQFTGALLSFKHKNEEEDAPFRKKLEKVLSSSNIPYKIISKELCGENYDCFYAQEKNVKKASEAITVLINKSE